MKIGLTALKETHPDTDYFWGVNEKLDELVILGKKPQPSLYRGKMFKTVPSLVSATDEELAPYPWKTPDLFDLMELRDEPELTPLFKTARWRYQGSLPYQLAPGQMLRRGEEVLYLNRLDIFQPISPGLYMGAYEAVCSYLASYPRIVYLLTATWLEKWVRVMGFQEATVSVARQEAEEFIANLQEIQLRHLFTKSDGFDMAKITEKALRNFGIGKFKWWFCLAQEFKLDM